MPKRSRVSVAPRLPAFIAAPGRLPVARIAGTRPKMRHVSTASAAVNAKTRQSSVSATKMRLFVGGEKADEEPAEPLREQRAGRRRRSPAISRLSASSWRTMRRRDAPIARRTAISRSRAVARASIRFARFAHAISSTSAGGREQQPERRLVLRRSFETPVPPGYAPSLNVRYCLASSAR